MSSPSRAFANAASGPWLFPRPLHLINLLKSLTRTSIVRVISDNDCPTLISEQHYQAFVAALGRTNSTDNISLLSTIDVQGFHVKPTFVKHLVSQIRSSKLTKLVSLSLQNCSIQDAEGQDLCKIVILGKRTPNLKKLCLAKNQLGFKFGASLIA